MRALAALVLASSPAKAQKQEWSWLWVTPDDQVGWTTAKGETSVHLAGHQIELTIVKGGWRGIETSFARARVGSQPGAARRPRSYQKNHGHWNAVEYGREASKLRRNFAKYPNAEIRRKQRVGLRPDCSTGRPNLRSTLPPGSIYRGVHPAIGGTAALRSRIAASINRVGSEFWMLRLACLSGSVPTSFRRRMMPESR